MRRVNYTIWLDDSFSFTFSVLSASMSPLQQHFRLGHPVFGKLKVIIPSNHFFFVRHSITSIIFLIFYVNDIIISKNDSTGIDDLKDIWDSNSIPRTLGTLRYFLRIEVARSFLSQKKYGLDLFSETGTSP